MTDKTDLKAERISGTLVKFWNYYWINIHPCFERVPNNNSKLLLSCPPSIGSHGGSTTRCAAHDGVTLISCSRNLSNMAPAYHESNIVTFSACLFTEKSGSTKSPQTDIAICAQCRPQSAPSFLLLDPWISKTIVISFVCHTWLVAGMACVLITKIYWHGDSSFLLHREGHQMSSRRARRRAPHRRTR